MRTADYIGSFWAGAEVMYGIIITMTFTSILRTIPIAPDVIVDKIVLAAIFCCIAWGIADGLFYTWERQYIIRRENQILDLSRAGTPVDAAIPLIGEELDDTILRTVPQEQRRNLYGKLVRFLSTVAGRQKLLAREAAVIIVGTFLLSAGAALVVVSPFYFIDDPWDALAVSNGIGILLLFVIGYLRGKGRDFMSRLLLAFVSSLMGIIIAAITVMLGG